MKDYKFKTLKIGQSESFNIKLKNQIVKKFINFSKDKSTIHIKKKFATRHGFKDKLVHGMLLGALYSRFIGMYLPGKYGLLLSIDVKFHKPIYVNDQIIIKGKISNINSAYKVVTINISALKKSKILLSSAKAMVKLNE